ncbi:MAG: type II CAAX endopeptidase family protein [Candidatus Cloacimonadaceae bacterium]
MPAIEMSNLMALIPVVNIALLFKAVMINDYQLSHLLITIISTLVLDVLAIWATIKLFNTEGILFRSDEDSGSLKSFRKNKASFFSPYNGVVYYSIALLLLYYLGSYLQQQDLARGLVLTQLLIIALPIFILIRAFKMNGNEVLRLKAPKLKELLLVPFIAIPASILVALLSQAINTIYPFPENYLKMLGGLFSMDLPLWASFLVIAVAPGICEELMFRGFLIRFFEKYGMKVSIVLSGLLFAAFHLDPFRFVPVLILGMILAYLTLRSGSIFNAMLLHTINNGFALVIMSLASKPFMQIFVSGEDNLRYWLAIPAVVILAWALYGFHKITGEKQCVE